MESERVLRSPNLLYSNFVDTGENKEIVEYLWDRVPLNLGEATEHAANVRKDFWGTQDRLERLKKAMKAYARKLGILTSRVEENINRIEQGVIEAGQQPMCLGGPSYILNKVACIWKLSEFGSPDNFVPVYYVADYDGIQSELLNIRIPSQSSKGLLVSLPAEDKLFETPIYNLSNPPEVWFRATIKKVRNNFEVLLKDTEKTAVQDGLHNLDHALTIIRNAYYSSENVSEWSTRILGTLINLEADLGVPILAFSTPDTRPLFQSGYELLLSETNRIRWVKTLDKAAEVIEKAGYKPQIVARPQDYVPFFLECMNDICNRKRIELHYRQDVSTAYLTGKCSSCGEEYSFSIQPNNPDLSEIVQWISPRVESRQIIVNSVIPVLCHVGGPGETSYYAQVIPAARVLRVPFPGFVRYTRTFYDTPWNRRYSTDLKKVGQPTLLNEDLFSALGKWVRARNAQDSEGLRRAHLEIRKSIELTYERLLEKMQALEREISFINKQLSETGDRGALIEEIQGKQRLQKSIDLYLSSAFGRFSPERFGQEVSWIWLDLATVSGVRDLLGVFLRQYNKYTPISSMFFANL